MKKIKRKGNCFENSVDKFQTSVSPAHIEFTAPKKKKSVNVIIDLLYVVLPSGVDGYRLELDGEDIGTVIYDYIEKRWRMINW